MNPLFVFIEAHWFAVTLLTLAALLGMIALWRWQLRQSRLGWTLAAGTLAMLGAGGLALPASEWAVWLAVAGLVALMLLFAVVVLSGHWSALLGFLCAALILVGVGGIVSPTLGGWLAESGRFVLSLTPLHLIWLVLLLLIPWTVWVSMRSLAGLGATRRWLVITLRCLAIAFLVLALTEAQARRQDENLTVLFAWDQSLSIPPELDDEKQDQRRKRIFKFINESVTIHGLHKHDDKVGLIVFGQWPRLAGSPGAVDKLQLNDYLLKRVAGNIDRTYTDIGAAIKLALASYPEGTNKRLVLITDGNENLGDAEEQAQIAKRNGVQIDVVPLATAREHQQEVVVLGLVAPPATEKDARVLLQVTVRSYSAQPVQGTLTLYRRSLVPKGEAGKEKYVFDRAKLGSPQEVTLHHGLNPFEFQAPPAKIGEAYIYEVQFAAKEGTLPGDRVENNQASIQVVPKGQSRVLLIEPQAGDHELLVKRLKEAKPNLDIDIVEPVGLSQDPTDLALSLSKYDTVLLANVPAESFTEAQQKVIRSNTHDQGCGLIMVGGPNGFGAGGWQGTDVEKALPVTCELKATKVEGKGGLALIMHASEIAQGVHWQKKVAALAVEKLSPADMVGVVYYDWNGGHKWHIPFQMIGPNKQKILQQIDTMNPGDMPDLQPSLQMAFKELTDPKYKLSTKHIIFISDGDHWQAPMALLQQVRNAKITVTTVCITSHGQMEYTKMAEVARITNGSAYPKPEPDGSYKPLDPRQLPAIYTKEARLVSKSFLYLQKLLPTLVGNSGPAVGLPRNLEHLYGMVLTTKRESPLVQVPIWSKIGKEDYPVLAHWHYGLGKAAAFTSDARTKPGAEEQFWDHDWATRSAMHGKFWQQMVDWSMRDFESGTNLNLSTEIKEGKIRITVRLQDDKKVPVPEAQFEAGISSPSLEADTARPKLQFEQTKPGTYEAEFKAEEIGSYFINVKAKWRDEKGQVHTDGARAGVTIPYSPEFAEMSSNLALLTRLADITGGKVYADNAEFLEAVAHNGDVFRPVPVLNVNLLPIWPWLVLLAALCLFFDVALRRLAFEPEKWFAAAQNFWARLRGHRVEAATAPQFLDRLQTRKAQIGQELEKKAARRFDGDNIPVAAPPPGATDMPASAQQPGERKPPAGPRLTPEKEPEPEDYASRLRKAKQKVWKERDQGQ